MSRRKGKNRKSKKPKKPSPKVTPQWTDLKIEELREHLAMVDEIDERVEAKIAALERTSHRTHD